MPNGSIKSYVPDQEIGLIKPEDQSRFVFFTGKVVEGGVKWVAPGVQVTYELYNGEGTPEAKLVRRRG